MPGMLHATTSQTADGASPAAPQRGITGLRPDRRTDGQKGQSCSVAPWAAEKHSHTFTVVHRHNFLSTDMLRGNKHFSHSTQAADVSAPLSSASALAHTMLMEHFALTEQTYSEELLLKLGLKVASLGVRVIVRVLYGRKVMSQSY